MTHEESLNRDCDLEQEEREFFARCQRMRTRRYPNPRNYDSDIDYYEDRDAWSYARRHLELFLDINPYTERRDPDDN